VGLEKTGLPVLIVFCVGVAIVLIFEIFFCIQQAQENQESFSQSSTKGNTCEYYKSGMTLVLYAHNT
jgi:hypothetical protein